MSRGEGWCGGPWGDILEVTISGRAFIGGSLVNCTIGIRDGRIAAIKKILEGEEHYDYRDMIILPAAVDAHVHMRDPGLTHKEDFSTGTLAAAFGGVSCVLDMPNTLPPVVTRANLIEKKEAIARKAWVDYGLFGGCAAGRDPLRMADGVIGYKLYMASTTGNLLVEKDEEITSIVDRVSRSGKVLSIHAEDEALIRKKRERNLEDHLENRPAACEVSAIEKITSLCSYPRINICHVSSPQALRSLEGRPFLREVTPHHLLLSVRKRLGPFGKVNPPLRTETARAALFEAFSRGEFDILASDHAPHTKDEKEFEDFEFVPSGVPGVETMVPLMLSLVKRDILPLNVLVRACAGRPAEVFGLNKGAIEVGKDADLIVVDMGTTTTVKGEELHSKCGWTPFEGWTAIFPRAVFIRGRRLIDDYSLENGRCGRDVTEIRAGD